VVPSLVGGMTGAFLVLVAVLRLYSSETSWRRVASGIPVVLVRRCPGVGGLDVGVGPWPRGLVSA